MNKYADIKFIYNPRIEISSRLLSAELLLYWNKNFAMNMDDYDTF